MHLDEISIRDPYILADPASGKYYLYGTTGGMSFKAYVSSDLIDFCGPFEVFSRPKNFEPDRDYWAPEIYKIDIGYLMIASFKTEKGERHCRALIADNPLGQFAPYGEQLTPKGWECLDGTLVEEDGSPYLIFCHEWLQTKVGEICSVKLKESLSGPDGEPKVLFKASDSKWAKSPAWGSGGIIVTDGPFCLSIDGHNALIWSSYDERGNYVTGASYPAGKFHCPNYVQSARRPFLKNAGHGMCFRDFDGRWRFIAHQEGGIHEFPIIKSISLDTGKVVLL